MAINWRDLVGGAAILVIGGYFSVNALYLGVGSTRNMGAGYFPLLGGLFTMVISLFIIAASLARSGHIERPAWRAFLGIVGSIVGFIAIFRLAGLLPAIFATVTIAALADPSSRLISTLLLAAFLCVSAWLIFIVGLGLPIRPYRMPF